MSGDANNPVYVDNQTVFGDGTSAHPLSAQAGSATVTQKVSHTVLNTDVEAGFVSIPFVFATPFPDTNYSPFASVVTATGNPTDNMVNDITGMTRNGLNVNVSVSNVGDVIEVYLLVVGT